MFNKTAKANLLMIARAYAKATGLSTATVAKRFHGKQRFFKDLKSGDCTVSVVKLDSMIKAFGAAWPENAKWPETTPITMGRPQQGESRPQVSAR